MFRLEADAAIVYNRAPRERGPMSFWSEVAKGVVDVGSKAAEGASEEAKKSADSLANRLKSDASEQSRVETGRKTAAARPNEITKTRLEKPSKRGEKGTIDITGRQNRADEIYSDVMENASDIMAERKDRAESGADLMPDVEEKDDEYIDKKYDFINGIIGPGGRTASSRAHWKDDMTMGESRRAKLDEARRNEKREADEKKAAQSESVVIESDEPDYSWDDDAGMFVDNRKKKQNEAPLSYEQDLKRRSENGDVMYVPESGQWIDAGDGRVYDGHSVNKYGDNVLMSHFITGDWSNGHAAAGYEEDDLFPVLTDIANGISDGITRIDSGIRNARANAAEANADWRFRTKDGRLYDFEDTRDSFETDEFRDYYDDYLKSERTVTRSKPDDIKTTDKMYSGGSWYAPMRDIDGNAVYESGEPKMIRIGTFDASSNFDDSGNPIPDGSFDEDTGMWKMPNGVYIDAVVDDDGNIFPQATYQWDVETDDEGKAIAWNEPYESFESIGRREIPISDVLELVGGDAKRENLNDDFIGPVPDFLGLNKTPEEIVITDENGNIDFGKMAQNAVPLLVDGALSSVPFLNPVTGGIVTGNNILQATRGLDPYSYDATNGTYEAPSTMAVDQYNGHVAGVAAETLFDAIAGLGAKFGVGKPVKDVAKSVFREFFPETAESAVRKAVRDARKLERPLPARLARTGASEAWAESVPELFGTLDRGDYAETYFANQKRDENGNLMWDEAGNPIWDEDTSFADRGANALNSILPSAALGGTLGVLMGGPGDYGQYKRDRAIVRARDGYIPLDRSAPIESGKLTEEERAAAMDWYKRQQEEQNG